MSHIKQSDTHFLDNNMRRCSLIFSFLLILSYSFLFAEDVKDTPKTGEGIQAFLKRHNIQGKEYEEEFITLNKATLGKGNSLLKGVSYRLPSLKAAAKQTTSANKTSTKGAKKKNTLFGSKYEDYVVLSDRLAGACFFLSSGHGGPDPGAIGKVNGKSLHEDEYAYDVTLRLARRLLEEGATVHMIIQDALDGIRDDMYLSNSNRETCMGAAIPLNQVKRLKQRSDKINSLNRAAKEKYKREVFIHVDSRSQKSQLDVFFYYATGSVDGKKLSNTMKETFRAKYQEHQPGRGFAGTVSERNLYVLNNTIPVGIYAELGNIQNAFDQQRFLDPNNRQALANWMCLGFMKDYENSKKK